jgi:hypothetical protein
VLRAAAGQRAGGRTGERLDLIWRVAAQGRVSQRFGPARASSPATGTSRRSVAVAVHPHHQRMTLGKHYQHLRNEVE